MRLFKTTLLFMSIAGIVPAVMVSWLAARETRKVLIKNSEELVEHRIRQVRLKVQNSIHGIEQAALSLAKKPGFMQLTELDQRQHIQSILDQRPEILAITIFDADRNKLFSQYSTTSLSSFHDSWAPQVVGRPRVQVSDSYSDERGKPCVTLGFPLGHPSQGYASAELSFAELGRLLTSERTGSSSAYLVDSRGHLIGTGIAPGRVGDDLSARAVVSHWIRERQRPIKMENLEVGNFQQGNESIIGAFAAMPQFDWAVILEQPVDTAYEHVVAMERGAAAGLGSALIVAVILAAWFSRKLTRPIKQFNLGALDLARGKFGIQVKVKSKNEIGDLAKTFNYMSQQLMASSHENQALYESLEKGYLQTIVALANSIDSKDAYTRGHSQRVGDLSVEIARELGLTETEVKLCQYGGILHDIGKIGIVESILFKQTQLTAEEMLIMREHPVIGDAIVQPVGFLKSVRAAVRNHHERWDGNGYPDRLKGDQIPIVARIVNCADTFDACTSTRPYQKAVALDQAVKILETLRGAQLDPKVVDALIRVVRKRGAQMEGYRGPVKLAS